MLRFSRTFSAYTLLFCLIYIFSGCLCMKKGHELYMDGFRQLAVRSRPLVETIKKYEREHGAPPPSLEALVPDYLPAVPGTGMGTCPKYDYDVHVGSPPRHGNTWTLTVWAPKFFDHFIYYPNQNYIQPNSGEYLEPIEDWAYYHE